MPKLWLFCHHSSLCGASNSKHYGQATLSCVQWRFASDFARQPLTATVRAQFALHRMIYNILAFIQLCTGLILTPSTFLSLSCTRLTCTERLVLVPRFSLVVCVNKSFTVILADCFQVRAQCEGNNNQERCQVIVCTKRSSSLPSTRKEVVSCLLVLARDWIGYTASTLKGQGEGLSGNEWHDMSRTLCT